MSEYYPIQRASTAVRYYNYDSPLRARANTNDKLEDRRKRAANFFLYQDETGSVSFTAIMAQSKADSRFKLEIQMDTTSTPQILLRDGPIDKSVRWNASTKTATADFSWKDTTKGVIIGPLTTNNSRERACVTVRVTDHPKNIDYLVVHGHTKPSAKANNPEALTLYEYDALLNTTIRICHTKCSCAKPETLTALSGEIDSFSTEFGTSFTFNSRNGIMGSRYSDNIPCTWLFNPPNAAGISFQFSKWDVSKGDNITLYKGTVNNATSRLIDAYSDAKAPTPRNFQGNRGGLVFNPNKDGNTGAG